MNFLEALKTGRPVRINKTLTYRSDSMNSTESFISVVPNTWIDTAVLIYSKGLSKELLLDENWEVKPNYAVEIVTAVIKQIGSTYHSASKENSFRDAIKDVEEILIKVKSEKS